jgi:small nuclear ribonucleoprotein B and B'
MPDPYRNTSVIDQRDAITRALMGIASPPPQSRPPMMPGYRQPVGGLPQMPPAGAPPMGAPPPQGLPQSMPLTPGVPPMRPGMVPPGAGPGAAMPLNPNPMQRPGGL